MGGRKCSFDERLIINTAYRDVGIRGRLKAHLHIRKCTECASLYNASRHTARMFRSIRPEKCPEHITKTVEERIGLRAEGRPKFIDQFIDFVLYKPSYAVSGTVVVLIVAAILTLQVLDPYRPSATYYSDEEIQQAREDIEKTFAMIYPVVLNAQISLRDQIIQSQIIPPVQSSLQQTNQLFIKGLRQQ